MTLVAVAEVLACASRRWLLDLLLRLRISELMLADIGVLTDDRLFAWSSLIEGGRCITALVCACENSFARLIRRFFVAEHIGQVFAAGVGEWTRLARDDGTAELVPWVHHSKGRQSVL